jgi:RimJ/RimL family protein N-acetyltransferase
MLFKLKNGKQVEIKKMDNSIAVEQFLKHISKIVLERPEPFINLKKPPSLKEEKKWLINSKAEIKKGNLIHLVALDGNEIVGSTEARRKPHRDSDKAEIGIAISKKYRNQGLGKKLLKEIIKEAKSKFKPKIIYLTVIAGNTDALRVYEKLGFKEVARLPKWQKVRGKYHDFVYMKL